MKRLDYSLKNLKYSYIGNIAVLVLQFISRSIFIQYVGSTYLGLESVFSNILGVLSFAELGIGTSINFSLYSPVASDDQNKIKALLYFYKECYKFISIIIFGLGIVIIPFLPFFAKPEGINYYYIVYFVYLINSVTSYFVSFKFSLPNAEQKNYIYTNIGTLGKISIIFVQIIILVVTKNFLLYALSGLIVNLLQKLISNYYLNKKYPIFKTIKQDNKLDKNELIAIKKNVKGLIYHRIGEMSVYQTDNLIISSVLGVAMAGIISNYNLIINSVSTFTSLMLNSVNSSLGNMCATENEEYQYNIFRQYNFIAFWLYGFCAIALYILINPFIQLWIGEAYLISEWTVFFIVINFYFLGYRICINNFKVAAGIFYQDRYLSIIQAIVNLVVSIALVLLIGLPGVFIGTVVQGLISNIYRTKIIYNIVFHQSSKAYFVENFKFLVVVIIASIFCKVFQILLLSKLNILIFAAMMLVVIIIPNLIFYMFYHKSDLYKSIVSIIIRRLRRN